MSLSGYLEKSIGKGDNDTLAITRVVLSFFHISLSFWYSCIARCVQEGMFLCSFVLMGVFVFYLFSVVIEC